MVPAGDNYIVGVVLQQSGIASSTQLLCGSSVVTKNYAKDIPNVVLNYHCTENIIVTKTGQDDSFVTMSYISANNFARPMIASVSGQMDYSPATAYSFGHSTYIMWFGMGIVILLLAIQIGLKLFDQ